MQLSLQDLMSLYLLAQHGAAALLQRTEAALAAAQATQVQAATPDSTPPKT